MTTPKRKDGYEISTEHHHAILAWLNLFGGLTTRQLARLIWGKTPSALRMAQRTVSSLLPDKKKREPGFVLRRSLKSGGYIYVLSERGARLLRANGEENVSSRGHRDLQFEKPMHRQIANEFAIDQHLKGLRIWPEFQIQRRCAPVPEIIIKKHPKIPDLVTQASGYFSWIEVENAFKSQTRLKEMVTVANRLFGSEGSGFAKYKGTQGYYGDMTFVAADPRRLLAVLRCFHEAISREETTWDITRNINLVQVEMSSRFLWGGVIGTISAESFLWQLETHIKIQEVLQNIFEDDTRDLGASSNFVLWKYCIQIFRASELSLLYISESLEIEINDYEELEARAAEIAERVSREWMINYISQMKDKWLKADIGFTPQYFSILLEKI